MNNLPECSIWLTLKMCVRLLLSVTRVRLITLIDPKAKHSKVSVQFLVECGSWMLQLHTQDLGPLSSASKPKARKPRKVAPVSSSTVITTPEISRRRMAASLPPVKQETSLPPYIGRGLEP